VSLGTPSPVTDHLAVEPWAQEPLAVPELGEVAADRVEKFSGQKPGSKAWQAAMQVRELLATQSDRSGRSDRSDRPVAPDWTPAASTPDGIPIVLRRATGKGSTSVFGHDLSEAAKMLCRTTRHGVNHRIYDRDTACGLERLFRLVGNACAYGHGARPAATPQLRAEVLTDRQTYGWGETLAVEILVRDAEGKPCDANVRVGLSGNGDAPVRFAPAEQKAPGRYVLRVPLVATPSADSLLPAVEPATEYRRQRFLQIFADATRPGWVSDWAVGTVRVGNESDEAGRLAQRVRQVANDLLSLDFSAPDKEKWVEVEGAVAMPAEIRAGQPVTFELTLDTVENDTGNDWMEDVELVLKPETGGAPVSFPVAPGKCLTAPRSSVVAKSPDRCVVVDSAHPARFRLAWPDPRPGRWSLWLRYRYSDDYHIKDTDRLQREDAFSQGVREVVGG